MKLRLVLLPFLTALAIAGASTAKADYPSQFIGVCQKTGLNIYAYYQPVQCTNGCVQWQWVTHHPPHCRPAYKGRKRVDLFHSHLFNPANKKKKRHSQTCAPSVRHH
ncbi:MAG: hypothetical protein AAGA96_15690 [Verrucomicrobiota bacterium]